MSETKIFELKERAKWSKDSAEKKTAIRELAGHGDKALAALGEIMSVTAYEDIRAACREAIKAIEGKGSAKPAAPDQKKEEEKQGAAKLGDLPP